MADSTQSDVTSLPSATSNGFITVETDCAQNSNVATVAETGLPILDPLFGYPFGLVTFEVACSPVNVTLYFHGSMTALTPPFRKFGLMAPGFVGPPQYYTLPGAVFGTAVVGAQTVATVMYTLVDNQLGDGNPALNVITDPAGPAVLLAEPAPLMSRRGLLLLAVALCLVALFRLARQRLT